MQCQQPLNPLPSVLETNKNRDLSFLGEFIPEVFIIPFVNGKIDPYTFQDTLHVMRENSYDTEGSRGLQPLRPIITTEDSTSCSLLPLCSYVHKSHGINEVRRIDINRGFDAHSFDLARKRSTSENVLHIKGEENICSTLVESSRLRTRNRKIPLSFGNPDIHPDLLTFETLQRRQKRIRDVSQYVLGETLELKRPRNQFHSPTLTSTISPSLHHSYPLSPSLPPSLPCNQLHSPSISFIPHFSQRVSHPELESQNELENTFYETSLSRFFPKHNVDRVKKTQLDSDRSSSSTFSMAINAGGSIYDFNKSLTNDCSNDMQKFQTNKIGIFPNDISHELSSILYGGRKCFPHIPLSFPQGRTFNVQNDIFN